MPKRAFAPATSFCIGSDRNVFDTSVSEILRQDTALRELLAHKIGNQGIDCNLLKFWLADTDTHLYLGSYSCQSIISPVIVTY